MIKEIIDFQDKEFQEKLINGSEKDVFCKLFFQ